MMEQGKQGKCLDSLEVWWRARDFAVRVCKDTLPLLPEVEKWALNSQIRRAVQSVPANIAEGYGRYSYQEGVRFGYIARGSLDEVYSQLTLAYELNYLSKAQYDPLIDELKNLSRLLNGYLTFLKKRKQEIREYDGKANYHIGDFPDYLID